MEGKEIVAGQNGPDRGWDLGSDDKLHEGLDVGEVGPRCVGRFRGPVEGHGYDDVDTICKGTRSRSWLHLSKRCFKEVVLEFQHLVGFWWMVGGSLTAGSGRRWWLSAWREEFVLAPCNSRWSERCCWCVGGETLEGGSIVAEICCLLCRGESPGGKLSVVLMALSLLPFLVSLVLLACGCRKRCWVPCLVVKVL